jgi:hypothetical protein
VGLTAQGLLTDGGPKDQRERAMLELTGWRPYSANIGGFYVPYRKYLGFLGPVIAATSDMYAVAHHLSDGDLNKAGEAATMGFNNAVVDETWMRGLADFLDALRHSDRGDGEKYMKSLATSMLPFSTGMAQTAAMLDPYQREARTILDAARNKIPGVRNTLLPQRDIWGQPIASHTMLTPGAPNADPVNAQMMRLNVFPEPVKREIKGVKLTDAEHDEYARTAGMMAHAWVSLFVSQPGFNNIPPGIAAQEIRKLITKSREDAEKLVQAHNLNLIRDAMQSKQTILMTGKKPQ